MNASKNFFSARAVRILAAGFFASVVAAPASSEELFAWDADSLVTIVEGGLHECLKLDGGSVIDVTEKHSGLASIRHNLSDSQGNRGCAPSKQASGGDIFAGNDAYLRWWMKISSDMDWGHDQKKAKFGRFTRTNESNPLYTTLYLHDDSFQWSGAFNPTGSSNNTDLRVDFNPEDGSCRSSRFVSNLGADCTEWREYILYYKQNTCPTCDNGVARLYVNGQIADEATNLTFAEYIPEDGVTTFNYAWAGVGGRIYPQLCPPGGSCGAGGTIWIDDISIATEWNSTEFSEQAPVKPLAPNPFDAQ